MKNFMRSSAAVLLAAMMILLLNVVTVRATTDTSKTTVWAQLAGGTYTASPSTLATGESDALRLTLGGLLRVSNGGMEQLSVYPVQPASYWSGTSTSAVNATPTGITVAAGSTGVRHVCTGMQLSAFQDATGTVSVAAGLIYRIRDGSTTKFQGTISFPATANAHIAPISVVFQTPIVGSAATDMVIELASAPLAHTGFAINAQGFDIK